MNAPQWVVELGDVYALLAAGAVAVAVVWRRRR